MRETTAKALGNLRDAYELVLSSDRTLDGRWNMLLGPILDLLAGVADVIEGGEDPGGQ